MENKDSAMTNYKAEQSKLRMQGSKETASFSTGDRSSKHPGCIRSKTRLTWCPVPLIAIQVTLEVSKRGLEGVPPELVTQCVAAFEHGGSV